MEEIGGLFVLVIGIILLFSFLYEAGGPLLIVGIFSVPILWFIFKYIRKVEREEAEKIRKQFLVQDNLRKNLIQCREGALSSYTRIPIALLAAEKMLERAEIEFKEGAFSPFWEVIESVLLKLDESDHEFKTISSFLHKYIENKTDYNGEIETFPIDLTSAKKLSLANNTQQHMREIVREAQKNFQFATIYEQRRTTNILIAGFNNLGEAIEGMGNRISSAIHSLSYQIGNCSRG